MKHTPSADCVSSSACSEMTISAKCSGILNSTNALIGDENDWLLRMIVRPTLSDDDNGDMSTIGLPVTYVFPPSRAGELSLKVKSSDLTLIDGFGFHLPACTSAALGRDTAGYYGDTAVLGATIIDPAGNNFATAGNAAIGAAAENCGIDLAAKAKGIKSDLVRAFDSCPPISFPAPNSSTGAGIPSCVPPFALSNRRFHEGTGRCRVAIRQETELCPDGSGDACTPMTVDLKCTGIVAADGQTLLTEAGWMLRLIVRSSTTDPVVGDVTVADQPADFSLPQLDHGKLKFRAVRYELPPFLTPTDLLGCTSMQIIDVKLVDSTGAEFARLGTAVFPK